MRELNIVFSRSKKRFPIFSWLIRLWTRKPYSHVAREVKRQDWGAGYYQASEGKVNYEHEEIFHKKHEIVKCFCVHIPEDMEMQIRKECWLECGNNYGALQNLGIVLTDICRWLGFSKVKNPWKKGRNCSELLYLTVFKQLHPELDYDPDTIKPHHIDEILTTKYRECEVKE